MNIDNLLCVCVCACVCVCVCVCVKLLHLQSIYNNYFTYYPHNRDQIYCHQMMSLCNISLALILDIHRLIKRYKPTHSNIDIR